MVCFDRTCKWPRYRRDCGDADLNLLSSAELPDASGPLPLELISEAGPASDSYRRLAHVFHEVLSEQSLDSLLERIADTLSDLIPHDSLTIYEADDTQRLLKPVLSRDPWADKIMASSSKYGEGITGWAVDHREPVLANQAHLDPRVNVSPGHARTSPRRSSASRSSPAAR